MDATPEIIVTGRALERPAAEQPLSVVRLDREALQASPVTGLEQVLQQVSGLQLFRRSDARSANPTSQGLTLRALGGNAASRAQLVLDGVPQSDPFGGWVYWPAYDALSLAEVRVTRGGGSVASGPGALAGAVELTSALDVPFAAGIDVGSHGSAEGRVLASGELAGGAVGISLRGARGDGFAPIAARFRGPADGRAPYENVSGRLRWVGEVTDATELQASLSGFHDDRSRGLAFSDNSSRGLDASVRLVGRGAVEWSLLGYGQWRGFRSSFAAVDAARTTVRRTSLQYDVPGQAWGWSAEVRPPLVSALELRLGTDGRLMNGRSLELGSYVGGVPTRDRRSGGRSGHAGAFAELAWRGGPWLATAGARLDRWWIADGFFIEEVLATGARAQDQRPEKRTGWLPTGRVAAERELGGGLSLRSAAYLSWRLPTLNELFRPFRLGNEVTAANADLRPERLVGAEAGLRWARGHVRIDLTGFWHRLRNPIANVSLGAGPGSFPGVGFVPAGGTFRQRRNLEAIRSAGLEVDAEWRRGPWSAGLSASRAWAAVSASGPAAPPDGLRPAQTPAWTGNAQLGWSQGGAAVTAVLRYIGAQYEDDLNRLRLPGAVTLDALGSMALGRQWQIVARAENLFDREVAAAVTSDGVIERATPRTFWLGLRFNAAR